MTLSVLDYFIFLYEIHIGNCIIPLSIFSLCFSYPPTTSQIHSLLFLLSLLQKHKFINTDCELIFCWLYVCVSRPGYLGLDHTAQDSFLEKTDFLYFSSHYCLSLFFIGGDLWDFLHSLWSVNCYCHCSGLVYINISLFCVYILMMLSHIRHAGPLVFASFNSSSMSLHREP